MIWKIIPATELNGENTTYYKSLQLLAQANNINIRLKEEAWYKVGSVMHED